MALVAAPHQEWQGLAADHATATLPINFRGIPIQAGVVLASIVNAAVLATVLMMTWVLMTAIRLPGQTNVEAGRRNP